MEASIAARLGEGRGLTVADYLRAEVMEERAGGGLVADDGIATFQCVTPGEMVAGWMRKLRWRRKGGEAGGGGMMQAKCLTKCFAEETSSSLGLVDESEMRKEAVDGHRDEITSFKLGAGLGLALVVAASKNELDKMVELRKQMEMMVENAKEELLRKSAVCDSSPSRNNQTCFTTNIEESMYVNNQTCFTTNIEESMYSNGPVSDPSCSASPYIEIVDEEWSDGQGVLGGMAQLESELEAELQLLELQLESQDSSSDNQDPVEESSDGGCGSSTCEEEVKLRDEPMDAFVEAHSGGVPPVELERRLHELLESQQQERIKELEAALRRAKLKLKKKEVEVSWWRDTAHLISRHVSQTAPNCLASQKDRAHENFT